MQKSVLFSIVGLVALLAHRAEASLEIKGLAEFGVVSAEYDKPWLNSWMEGGVGVLRYDSNELIMTQSLVELSAELGDTVTANVVLNYQPDGDTQFGASEAYIQYQPISSGWRQKLKVGMFYPKMSLENSDLGWTSPYTYSFSAINSWYAEELRTLGAEWTWARPGRAYRSAHSFEIVTGLYQANDGLASLLAWRGWALHNRQTVYGETVAFADYFQFQSNPTPNPTYVEPFIETDSRFGYYVGGHWKYLRDTDVRLYWYDNRADPFSVEYDMQYAWLNQFVSLSVMKKLSPNFRVLAQWLDGRTEMGDRMKGVHFDYWSWYALASYQWQDHRFSIRYDKFAVQDTDINPEDDNNSDGDSWTLAWRMQLTEQWHMGVEFLAVTSDNASRTAWPGWAAKHSQSQLLALLQYRF